MRVRQRKRKKQRRKRRKTKSKKKRKRQSSRPRKRKRKRKRGPPELVFGITDKQHFLILCVVLFGGVMAILVGLGCSKEALLSLYLKNLTQSGR